MTVDRINAIITADDSKLQSATKRSTASLAAMGKAGEQSGAKLNNAFSTAGIESVRRATERLRASMAKPIQVQFSQAGSTGGKGGIGVGGVVAALGLAEVGRAIFRDAIKESPKLGAVVADLRASLTGVVKGFAELVLDLPGVNAGLKSLNQFLGNVANKGVGAAVKENPITGAVIAGGTFALVQAYLTPALARLGTFMQTLGSSIFSTIPAGTAPAFRTALIFFVGMLTSLTHMLSAALQGRFNLLPMIMKTLLDTVKAIPTSLTAIGPQLQAIFAGVVMRLGGIIAVGITLAKVINDFYNEFANMEEESRSLFSGILEGAKDVFVFLESVDTKLKDLTGITAVTEAIQGSAVVTALSSSFDLLLKSVASWADVIGQISTNLNEALATLGFELLFKGATKATAANNAEANERFRPGGAIDEKRRQQNMLPNADTFRPDPKFQFGPTEEDYTLFRNHQKAAIDQMREVNRFQGTVADAQMKPDFSKITAGVEGAGLGEFAAAIGLTGKLEQLYQSGQKDKIAGLQSVIAGVQTQKNKDVVGKAIADALKVSGMGFMAGVLGVDRFFKSNREEKLSGAFTQGSIEANRIITQRETAQKAPDAGQLQMIAILNAIKNSGIPITNVGVVP